MFVWHNAIMLKVCLSMHDRRYLCNKWAPHETPDIILPFNGRIWVKILLRSTTKLYCCGVLTTTVRRCCGCSDEHTGHQHLHMRLASDSQSFIVSFSSLFNVPATAAFLSWFPLISLFLSAVAGCCFQWKAVKVNFKSTQMVVLCKRCVHNVFPLPPSG